MAANAKTQCPEEEGPEAISNSLQLGRAQHRDLPIVGLTLAMNGVNLTRLECGIAAGVRNDAVSRKARNLEAGRQNNKTPGSGSTRKTSRVVEAQTFYLCPKSDWECSVKGKEREANEYGAQNRRA
jgi:hypothetical protein